MQHTKEARLISRNYQFESLTTNGYTQDTYKELDFFTKNEGKYFTLKVFRGTAANHELYMNYHTAERREEVIERYKVNYDSRQTFKAEQKEKNKGKSSSHAGASAAIKAELKTNFPDIKFSVTSDSFSGGNSVHVSWTDGPTTEQVEKFSSKYQYGHFNGMEDIYENTNDRSDIPQVKYVQEQRNLSDSLIEAVSIELLKVRSYTEEQLNSYRENPKQNAMEMLYKTDIPTNYTGLSITENEEGCNYYDFFKIVFEAPEQTTKETAQPIQEVKGEINIIDYSEKAFAVIGDTKPIKDQLKALGGSFNARLSCGAGWIFSKKKLEEVTAALSEETNEPQEQEETKEPDTLRSEVIKTVEKFAYHDIENYGEIRQSTIEMALVQNVSLLKYNIPTYDNLQDITHAAKSGKVISLLNLSQLVNQ